MGCAGIACLTVALFGIDSGWDKMSGGGVEYFLQIQPNELERLTQPGESRMSWVPAQVRDIRKITLTVGTETLPRVDPPAEEPERMPDIFPPGVPSLGAGADAYTPPEPIRPLTPPPSERLSEAEIAQDLVPLPANSNAEGSLQCRQRLGGVHSDRWQHRERCGTAPASAFRTYYRIAGASGDLIA